MSIFDEDIELDTGKKGKQLGALGGRDKLPETPDFTEWGKEPRKGSPFLLDDFSSGAPANTSKP
jgi:hypothetical protein